MKKEEEKFAESEILEGMPSISAVINAPDYNNRRILCVWIDAAKKRSKAREISFLSVKSRELGFDIRYVDESEIHALTIGNSHGGIVAQCTPRTLPALSADHISANGVYYYLDGVEDPYNFGYAVRSLYASGADGLILPPRNWMGASGVVARSSAGASELMNLLIAEPNDTLEIFKQCGYTVVCAGIRDSVSLFSCELKKPLLVVLGGEKRGISKSILDQADRIVRIDYGTDAFRGSLSTAAAAAVFGFEILRYNKNNKK